MKKNEDMLREASFSTLALNLCIPTVLVMIVMVVYNMADVYFIGQTGNPHMIAGVSLCGPLFSTIAGIGTLYGTGGCTAISLALGRREYDKVKRFSSLCCFASFGTGLLLSAAILLGQNWLARFLGANDDTLAYTLQYLQIVGAAAPITLFCQGYGAMIRADGSAKQAMIGNLIGTITNIILDPVFILVLGWGVRGAAIATVIGNICTAIFLIWYVNRKGSVMSMSPRDVRLEKEYIIPIVTLGLPMAFNTVLMSVTHVVANNMMMQYGSIPLAAQSVAGKLGMLISMISMGICMGMQPAISYHYGARNFDRLRYIVKGTGILAFSVATTLSALCFLFRGRLLNAFIDNAEIQAIGSIIVLASVTVGPFFALFQLCSSYLQATGKAAFATLSSLLNKCLIYLPVLFLLHHFFGMYGIVFSGCVTDILSLICTSILVSIAGRSDQKVAVSL